MPAALFNVIDESCKACPAIFPWARARVSGSPYKRSRYRAGPSRRRFSVLSGPSTEICALSSPVTGSLSPSTGASSSGLTASADEVGAEQGIRIKGGHARRLRRGRYRRSQRAIDADRRISVSKLAVFNLDLRRRVASCRIKRIPVQQLRLRATLPHGNLDRQVRRLQIPRQVWIVKRPAHVPLKSACPSRSTGSAEIPLLPFRVIPKSRKNVSKSSRSAGVNFNRESRRAGHRKGAELPMRGNLAGRHDHLQFPKIDEPCRC